MRIWTTIFLAVTAAIITIASDHQAATMALVAARLLFALFVIAALLHAARTMTLQMAGLADPPRTAPPLRQDVDPSAFPRRADEPHSRLRRSGSFGEPG